MDVFTKQKRSAVMAKIRAKNTKPEVLVRKILFGLGLRFRLHNTLLPGKPDVCLAKYRTVVFVHGCFWHHHKNCSDGKMPKSNLDYWEPKIHRNLERDKKHKRALTRMGWKVLTVWECELSDTDKLQDKLKKEILSK